MYPFISATMESREIVSSSDTVTCTFASFAPKPRKPFFGISRMVNETSFPGALYFRFASAIASSMVLAVTI